MRHHLAIACSCVLVSWAAVTHAYELGFTGPTKFSGAPGSVHSAEYEVILKPGDGDGSVSRWSFHLGAGTGRITALTLEGTDAEPALDGGTVWNWIGPAGGIGFSVVELGGGEALPLGAGVTLLRLTLEATIPEGGGVLDLQFPQLATGEGEPPGHSIASAGAETVPETCSLEVSLVDTTCLGEPVNVGVSLLEVHSPEPHDDIEGSVSGRAFITLPVPAEGRHTRRLFINLVSRFPSRGGLEVFHLAILTEGGLWVEGARLLGWAIGSERPGASRRLEIIDIPTGLVRFLVKSSVFLGEGGRLPDSGTESVLSIDVAGYAGSHATISFQDNAWGEGGANLFTAGGLPFTACNQTSAVVEVRFEAAEVALFRRGDCNDDGDVDLTDAIFTLGALFLGDGEPSCDNACDSNADRVVDISDAIATLSSLFLGLGEIPLPGPDDCGIEPTAGGLACVAYASCSD